MEFWWGATLNTTRSFPPYWVSGYASEVMWVKLLALLTVFQTWERLSPGACIRIINQFRLTCLREIWNCHSPRGWNRSCDANDPRRSNSACALVRSI